MTPFGNGDVPSIVVHQNVRLSGVIASDILIYQLGPFSTYRTMLGLGIIRSLHKKNSQVGFKALPQI
jgi:hypothetical protein